MNRKKIQPGEKVSVRMTARERELLLEHTLADPGYAKRLHAAPTGEDLVGEYTLDELEDLVGFVAAQANYADDAQQRQHLDALFERLLRTQRSFDDGSWNDSAI